MRVNIRVAVLSCLVSSVALAQPAADGDGAPPPAGPTAAPVMAPPPSMAPPPPPEASHVDQGVIDDANAGRSWLSPTALTEPAGTWSFSDFELLLASISYSPTDQLSLSATTLLPITSDFPFWLLVNGKYQIVKAGNVRIVAQAAVSYVSVEDDSDSGSSTRSSVTGAVIGGAATYCIDSECHSTLTGYLGAGFAHEDQSAVPFVFSGALALGVNKHVKILLEGDSGFMAGSINDQIDGFLAWYGIRFTSKEIGVDLGFTRPICSGCDTGPLLLGVPFVSFTYRSIK
jgi:hypothetical protein